MTATFAPFGLIASYHPSGPGAIRQIQRTISSGYASALYQGNPFKIGTNGTVEAVAEGEAMWGVFCGVQYTSNNRPFYATVWPAGTVASDIICFGYEDPAIVYRIQASGSLSQTNVGGGANIGLTTSGNATTGLGAACLSQATVSTSGFWGLRIMGLYEAADNEWGDAYPIVNVQIAKSQQVADRSAV